MTKFEEEFKALTSWEWINIDLIQRILTRFGNWHSDEEFQEHFIANKNLIDVNTKLAEEIANLKSQLQQQALPVVPDFVAEWYEKKKNKLEIAVYSINTSIDKKSFNDLTKIEKWFEGVENKPIETIFKMKDGYQVEKPQLFYLKNKLTTSYLALDINTGYYEHWGEEIIPKLLNKQGYKTSFTKQEIDSMETGSYEQIEVAE